MQRPDPPGLGQREGLAGAAGLEPAKPLGRQVEGLAALSVCIRPRERMRAERFELSPKHVLSMPPLPFGLRARDMRAAGFEPAPRLFLREPPLPVGSRARLLIDTGGEIRTHMLRLLRTACLPFAPLPRVMLEEGVEPSRAKVPPALSTPCVCRYATPARLSPPTPGEGLEPSSPVPKTGVLPLDDPGI